MSAEKLAFLQNFYTDVTLYVPAEPVPDAAVASASAPALAAPASAPAVAKAASPAVAQPERPIILPPTGFSHPSAGLERLASGVNRPTPASEQPAAAPKRPSAGSKQAAEDSERSAEGHLSGLAAPTAHAAAPAVSPVMLTQFTTLGSNAQGVVFLFRLPPEQFGKLHRNVFLNKMLQALNLVMADVVLVNVEAELPVALASLRRELAATHIVAFGKNLLDATIRNTQIYEPVQFPSLGFSYLASATVELVEYDTSLKKRLWPGLQRMFLG